MPPLLAPDAVRTTLRGRVVTPAGVLEDGLVVIGGERLTWVGPADQAPQGFDVPEAPGPDRLLLPGLVDVHCHGGGGASFPDALDTETATVAAREHLAHGTTSLVASLVTADEATLLARTALLAELAEAGEVVGIHIEGPFLSRTRCGAQNPGLMRSGDAGLVRELAGAGRGHLLTMTVAPEAPGVLGADGALEALARAGAVPSIGHTDASSEVTEQALEQAWLALKADGARSSRPSVTHLFNGMRPMHHRDPGPIAACLAAAAGDRAVIELIGDGVHLAEATVRTVFRLVGADAIALVTDAMAAAGMPDGRYQLGPVAVRVRDGVARLEEGNAIAGGTAHLLDVVRWTVGAGVGLVEAVRSASTTPAGVIGRPDLGALETGRRADLVVVDGGLKPLAVMRRGTWTAGGPQAAPR